MNALIVFEKTTVRVTKEEMPSIRIKALWLTLKKFKPFLPLHVTTWLEERKASPLCLYCYIGYSVKDASHYFWDRGERIYSSVKLFDDEPSKVTPCNDVNAVIPEIIFLLNELKAESQTEKIKCPPGYFVFKYNFGIRTRETEGANQKGLTVIKATDTKEAEKGFKRYAEMEVGLFFKNINVYKDSSFH